VNRRPADSAGTAETFANVFRGLASVLDVGGDDPAFAQRLHAHGVPRVVSLAREGIRGGLPPLGERFEGIFLGFVVETVDGPTGAAVLRDAAALLAPSGILVVRALNPGNPAAQAAARSAPAGTPWPLEELHQQLRELGLRIVGAGYEPDGWQHTYVVGRAAGAAPSPGDATAVAFQGEFFAHNSMAVVNRELARALQAFADVAPAIVPDEPAAEPSLGADPRFAALRETMRRGVPACDVLIRQSNGLADFSRPPGVRTLVQILPWEYGALPRAWVDALRSGGADEIWTPSAYCRQLFLDAGIAAERVVVVPNGIDPARFTPLPDAAPFPLATHKHTRFLYLGGMLRRKGVDVLLAAYRRAFSRDDDVALVLKLFGTRSFYQLDDGGAALRAFAADPHAPELVVIEDDLTDEDVARLYRSCDALVFPYRGEGFGLPMLEALACGVPVIATAGGAADAFLDETVAFPIPAERRALSGPLARELAGPGWWLEPDVDALARTLRTVAAHPGEARAKAALGAERARTRWTWDAAARIAAIRLRALRERAAPS
jgi:glycosyltransferase involved in cell wall biosynthesis